MFINNVSLDPLMNELLNFQKGVLDGSGMEIIDSTGPYHVTRAFFKKLPTMNSIVALPNSYFYPVPNFPEHRVYGEEIKAYFQKNSFCCHLRHCSWLKKKNKPESFLSNIMKKFRRQ